jgi:hypothetical protein
MHEWENTFAPANRGGHGHRHSPTWKCKKCGTRVEDWNHPPGDLRVRASFDRKTRQEVLFTCDEYITYQVMES